VREVNRYTRPLNEFYVRPCGAESWGDNHLAKQIIDVGMAAEWRLLPGCWDIEAVAADSRTWINPGEIVTSGHRLELTAP
jgi:hypothetical protein